MSESSSADFRHLRTLRLNGLHEIVINPAFTGLVARLEELEVTDLKNLIPQVSPSQCPLCPCRCTFVQDTPALQTHDIRTEACLFRGDCRFSSGFAWRIGLMDLCLKLAILRDLLLHIIEPYSAFC